MNVDLAQWNYGLIFASLCALMGIIGVVSTRRSEERWLASGLFYQGVLLTFVVGSTYWHGAVELRLGGLAVVGVLIIRSFSAPQLAGNDESLAEDDLA